MEECEKLSSPGLSQALFMFRPNVIICIRWPFSNTQSRLGLLKRLSIRGNNLQKIDENVLEEVLVC